MDSVGSSSTKAMSDVAAGNQEFEFVLKCVTSDNPPIDATSVPQLAWDSVSRLAAWHGVDLALFAALRDATAIVPQDFYQALRTRCHAITTNNLRLSGDLLTLSSVLSAENIQHLVYKGPLLATQLYGNVATRTSIDLDIVVREGDIPRAASCLEDLGYSDVNGFSAQQRAAAFHYGFEHSFQHENGTIVDLHRRIVPEFVASRLDVEGFWKRAVRARLFGKDLLTFSPEDSLFVLCLHAAQHDWLRLCLFRDIAAQLRVNPDLDWDLVLGQLTDSHVEHSVLVALAITNCYWAAALPPEVLRFIQRQKHIDDVVETLRNHLWPSMTNPAVPQTDVRWLLRRTQGERVRDRFRYIVGMIAGPTEADFDAVALSRPFLVLYPAVRFFRLLHKRGRHTLEHFRQGAHVSSP